MSRILRRAGLHTPGALDPPPPVVRYEHKRPGGLIHFDMKRLASIAKPGHRVHGDRTRATRGAGYALLHSASDDHSRIGYAAISPEQTCASAARFFHMARARYSRFGMRCRRVLTDNGPCRRHWRFQKLLRGENLRQRFTRPYTPRTIGKAERLIQTALREWAYGRTCQNSTGRTE